MKINWKDFGIAYALWFIVVLIMAYLVYNRPNYDLISSLMVYQAVLILDFLVPLAISHSLLSVMIATGIPLAYYFSRNSPDAKEAALTSFLFGGASFVLLDLIVTLLITLRGLVLYGTFNLIDVFNFVFMYTIDEWIVMFAIISIASTISGLIAYFAVSRILKR